MLCSKCEMELNNNFTIEIIESSIVIICNECGNEVLENELDESVNSLYWSD